MPPNRWTVDAPNGTAFHEIMVLPNLAPHLARPEHMGPFPRLSADVQGPDPQPADNETTPEPIRMYCFIYLLSICAHSISHSPRTPFFHISDYELHHSRPRRGPIYAQEELRDQKQHRSFRSEHVPL